MPLVAPGIGKIHSRITREIRFAFFKISTDGLKIEKLHVPEAVQKGRDYELGCDYQLNNSEKLYALRWYKDFLEFYRYMPEDNPTRRTFNDSGVKINVSIDWLDCSLFRPPPPLYHQS